MSSAKINGFSKNVLFIVFSYFLKIMKKMNVKIHYPWKWRISVCTVLVCNVSKEIFRLIFYTNARQEDSNFIRSISFPLVLSLSLDIFRIFTFEFVLQSFSYALSTQAPYLCLWSKVYIDKD